MFTDVALRPDALARAGVSLNAVRLRLHARLPDGRVLRGMPAVARAWAATPPYRLLGRLTQVPPFSWIGTVFYNLAAYALWGWNRANRRW